MKGNQSGLARDEASVDLPLEPKRHDYVADAVRFGECEQCAKRDNLHPLGGAMVCGGCSQASYLSEWQDYAAQLRALLVKSSAATVSDAASAEPAVNVGTLTAEELRFVELVRDNPGCKLNSGEAWTETGPLWTRLEAMSLIECVGSYKWRINIAELCARAASSGG